MNNNEDPQGIYTELLEEMKIMKEKLKEVNEEGEVQSLTALSFEELKEGLRITGVLLAEGVHNGIFYPGQEIQKMIKNFKQDFIGMEVTVEHEKSEEYGDRKVGKITHVEFNPTLKAGLYKAEITDEDAVNDIEGGKLGATSLRLRQKKVTVGDFTKAVSLAPMNNTLTQFPACSNCNVFHIEDLSLKYYGIKEGDEKEMGSDKEVIVPEKTEDLQYKCYKCNDRPTSYKDLLKHWGEKHREEFGEYDPTYAKPPKLSQDELIGELAWSILGEYEDKEKAEACVKVVVECLSAYTTCIGKCMKTGKSMGECAKGCKGELSIEEHGATEAETKAMKTRCAKYPISPKVEHGGHVTKPSQYASVSEGMFADPCNYKYPMDDAHIMAAWAYSGKPENKSKGGYSDAEWGWMRNRIKARMKAAGHKVTEESEGDINIEGKEEVEEGESELKRTRCVYCKGLYESLSKHLPRCESRKKVLSTLYQCNYCEKSYKKELELVSHLADCNQYKLAQAELSEKPTEETPKEEKPKEEESTETPIKVEKPVEEKPKETPIVEKPVEKEVPKETPKVPETPAEEAKIVKQPPKKITKKELLDAIMKIKGKTASEKSVELLLEGEKDRW